MPVATNLTAAHRHWNQDFLSRQLNARAGDVIQFGLTSGKEASGILESIKVHNGQVVYVDGVMTSPSQGRFFIQDLAWRGLSSGLVGVITLAEPSPSYRIEQAEDGTMTLLQLPKDKVVCVNYAQAPTNLTQEIPPLNPSDAPDYPVPAYQDGIISLQSLPGAPGVLYMDFRGGRTDGEGWGTFDFEKPNVSNAQIKDVWKRVAEDFLPFTINVTTDVKVYEAAAANSKARCIVTPTTTAAPGAGGVAYLNSWGGGVCWAFYSSGKSSAEVISHEIGHTLGLGHDGRITPDEGYYGGHGSGSTGWAPIMGVGYYQPVAQWSKGEYTSANNTENDLVMITGKAGAGYRVDDTGNSLATSRYLEAYVGAQSPVTPVAPISKGTLAEFALQHPGDVVRGKQIFGDETKAACAKCHATDGRTVKAGPDLSGIGDKFQRRDLIHSILEPSSPVAIGYGTTIISTRDDDEFQGVIKQATESWIELMGGDGKSVRVAIENIKEQREGALSLMPTGLEAALTPQEFTDLIAYLESLRQPLDSNARVQGMPEEIAQAVRSVELLPFFAQNVRLEKPVWFGPIPGFTYRFVVLEHEGKSWIIERTPNGDKQSVLLDLSGQVRVGGATGLLGIAFHPKFHENRKYYLKYQVVAAGKITTQLVERRFNADFEGDDGTPSRLLLEIGSVTQDHHGGTIEFGPDGFLYLGMGDTGPQRDPQGHGQNLNVFWSKMLRLDVDRTEGDKAYGIPKDNPFVGRTNVLPEIWAYGFREPWRFSFDSQTHDLWVGDVGQDRVEEVGIVRKGENHGWNIFEGHTAFSEQYRRAGENYIAPVFSYSHRLGVSVTGGYVYRGKRAPLMQGHYICGDFESRRIWALAQTNRLLAGIVEIGRAPTRLVSFGQDHEGELYIVGYDSGIIYRMDLAAIDPTPRQSQVLAATSEQSPVLWRYSLQPPTNGWFQADFDDSRWALSPAGFGTRGTPGSVVRTEWRTRDIWLRRVFTLGSGAAEKKGRSLALRLHHDEDVEIFLNGKAVAREPRWTTGYVELPLSAEAVSALREGRNVLAIHCRQTGGGQYIDAGLIEYTEPAQ